MESLYRKYRPHTFADVVGQQHIVSTLEHAVAEGRLSHAYLFCGPRGTGKTTLARILAKSLLCAHPHDHLPCGTCEECQAIAAGTHPDVYELDAASRTGVDNVREEIINSVSFAPVRGSHKIYIIDEVHMLTTQAFNALLKTLEEPPEHVVFVLATTDPQKVPETILSRCQRFDFHRIGMEDIERRLAYVCEHEGFETEPEALALVARHARGGMRDALSTLEQLSTFGAGSVRLADARALLGEVAGSVLADFARAIAARDVVALFRQISAQVDQGNDLMEFTRDLVGHARDVYMVRVAGPDPSLFETDAEGLAALAEEAALFESAERLSRVLTVLDEAAIEMRTAPDTRLVLEVACTRLARPEGDLTLEALAERIARLEKMLAGGVVAPSSAAAAADARDAARGQGQAGGVSAAQQPPAALGAQDNKSAAYPPAAGPASAAGARQLAAPVPGAAQPAVSQASSGASHVPQGGSPWNAAAPQGRAGAGRPAGGAAGVPGEVPGAGGAAGQAGGGPAAGAAAPAPAQAQPATARGGSPWNHGASAGGAGASRAANPWEQRTHGAAPHARNPWEQHAHTGGVAPQTAAPMPGQPGAAVGTAPAGGANNNAGFAPAQGAGAAAQPQPSVPVDLPWNVPGQPAQPVAAPTAQAAQAAQAPQTAQTAQALHAAQAPASQQPGFSSGTSGAPGAASAGSAASASTAPGTANASGAAAAVAAQAQGGASDPVAGAQVASGSSFPSQPVSSDAVSQAAPAVAPVASAAPQASPAAQAVAAPAAANAGAGARPGSSRPAAAPAPAEPPQQAAAASASPASQPQTPAGGAVTDKSELQRRWKQAVKLVVQSQPSRGALLQSARATEDDGDVLTVNFPAGSSFALKMLMREDSQQIIPPLVSQVFGPRTIAYTMGGKPAGPKGGKKKAASKDAAEKDADVPSGLAGEAPGASQLAAKAAAVPTAEPVDAVEIEAVAATTAKVELAASDPVGMSASGSPAAATASEPKAPESAPASASTPESKAPEAAPAFAPTPEIKAPEARPVFAPTSEPKAPESAPTFTQASDPKAPEARQASAQAPEPKTPDAAPASAPAIGSAPLAKGDSSQTSAVGAGLGVGSAGAAPASAAPTVPGAQGSAAPQPPVPVDAAADHVSSPTILPDGRDIDADRRAGEDDLVPYDDAMIAEIAAADESLVSAEPLAGERGPAVAPQPARSQAASAAAHVAPWNRPSSHAVAPAHVPTAGNAAGAAAPAPASASPTAQAPAPEPQAPAPAVTPWGAPASAQETVDAGNVAAVLDSVWGAAVVLHENEQPPTSGY